MKIGVQGPEVFVPPEDGTVLPHGMSFTKPQPSYESGSLPSDMTFTKGLSHRAIVDEVSSRVSKRGAQGPLEALSMVVPRDAIDKGLSAPGGAASVAEWARAYERVLRSGGGPQALARLNMATRNLSNTLGVPFELRDFMRGSDNG